MAGKKESKKVRVTEPKQITELNEKITPLLINNFQKRMLKMTILAMFYKKDESNQYRKWYGYKIIEELSRDRPNESKPSPGSIYPILATLKKDGLIEEVKSKEGGTKRKEYQISEYGANLRNTLKEKTQLFRQPNMKSATINLNEGTQQRIKDEIEARFDTMTIDDFQRMKTLVKDLENYIDTLLFKKVKTLKTTHT